MTRLLALTVADAPEVWSGLGFTVDDITVRIGSTSIVCSGSAEDDPSAKGITDWMLTADDGPLPERIDGLLTGSVTYGDAVPRTPTTPPHHTNGVISMARGAPGSASSEFFFVINDQPALDFGGKRNPDGQGFAAFGRVINGMDVVRRIQRMPSAGQPPQRMVTTVRIQSVSRIK